MPCSCTLTTYSEGRTAHDLPAACSTTSLTTDNIAVVEGQIKPSANGYLQLRFASEVANSAITAKAGACFFLTRLS